ncbi:hypothetical protein DB88DRAFT_509014 [Papiliotrema laurentii]|uniref:Uncharacterized protein n=1 Tax=Papiliotrema laurentii TaxID=5418 RepID=A0AAD9L6E5_PAPLA|nr:hypothetical protein DB88DRAFT_509014 [Papiliotrema laurentii]
MCKKTTCPNDGKPTWWGCGNHIEIALADVPQGERCTCEHVPSSTPGMYEVPKRDEGAPIQVTESK